MMRPVAADAAVAVAAGVAMVVAAVVVERARAASGIASWLDSWWGGTGCLHVCPSVRVGASLGVRITIGLGCEPPTSWDMLTAFGLRTQTGKDGRLVDQTWSRSSPSRQFLCV